MSEPEIRFYHLAFKFETSPSGPICAHILDVESRQGWSFGGTLAPIKRAIEILCLADTIVSHNSYHFKVLDTQAQRLGMDASKPRRVDTQVEAKRVFPHIQTHSFAAWAKMLEYQRDNEFRGADAFSLRALNRCVQDVQMIAELRSMIAEEEAEADLDGETCSWGFEPSTCNRCHSQDDRVYWDSCENRESREGYAHAMAKDD